MLTLNIVDPDSTLEARLRDAASANGHSADEEARRIIDAALPPNHANSSTKSVADEIRDLFAPFGDVDLNIPARRRWSRQPPTFE